MRPHISSLEDALWFLADNNMLRDFWPYPGIYVLYLLFLIIFIPFFCIYFKVCLIWLQINLTPNLFVYIRLQLREVRKHFFKNKILFHTLNMKTVSKIIHLNLFISTKLTECLYLCLWYWKVLEKWLWNKLVIHNCFEVSTHLGPHLLLIS